MKYCVEFSGITKRYGQTTVLNDVSVGCPAGATTAIVGASGSGKTTMLRLVNGLIRPDAGQTRVFDEPVPESSLESFRRRMGYAVQGAALLPHLSVGQNISLVARLEGWASARIQARVHALLDEMELPLDVIDRLPRELSGGQQQRVGLCRALMLQPQLLLLDEPFSAVDPITRIDIYERFEFVKQHEGVSSLMVTHDLREARRLAEYVVILNDAAIAEHGPSDSVLSNPQDAYVQRLVESQLA